MTTEKLWRIDRFIAEKVMGWTLRNSEDDQLASTPEHYADAARNDGWYWDGQDEGVEAWTWKPTTDIHCSKALRDSLSKTWDWLLGRGGDLSEKPFGFALYKKTGFVDDVEPDVGASADSEELAVALCALKSVGVVVDNG